MVGVGAGVGGLLSTPPAPSSHARWEAPRYGEGMAGPLSPGEGTWPESGSPPCPVPPVPIPAGLAAGTHPAPTRPSAPSLAPRPAAGTQRGEALPRAGIRLRPGLGCASQEGLQQRRWGGRGGEKLPAPRGPSWERSLGRFAGLMLLRDPGHTQTRGSEAVLAAAGDRIPSRRSKCHPLSPSPPCSAAGEAEGDRHGGHPSPSPDVGQQRATPNGRAGGCAPDGTVCPQSHLSPSRLLPRGGQSPHSHAAGKLLAQAGTPWGVGTPWANPPRPPGGTGPSRALPPSPTPGTCSGHRCPEAALSPYPFNPIQSTRSRSHRSASIPAVPRHSQLPGGSMGDPATSLAAARTSGRLRRWHRVLEKAMPGRRGGGSSGAPRPTG